MKVAVVGLGYFGVHYVRISRELPDTELVAICDVFKDNVDKFTKKFPELKGYTDVDELLKHEGLEAVILITQATTHYDIAKKVLAAKKHLLIEKPLTTDAKQAVELVEIAKQSGVTMLVGHTFLYNKGIQATKQLSKTMGFGDLLYMYATRTNLGPFRKDVNAAWDLAPHDISIFQYITGKVPSWVCAVGAKPLCANDGSESPRRKKARTEAQEDVVFITMGYENSNLVSHIHVSWANPKKVRELTLVGTGMRVVFDDMDNAAHVKVYKTPVEGPNKDVKMNVAENSEGSYQDFLSAGMSVGDTYYPAVAHGEPLKDQVLDFLKCCKEGTQPPSDAQFGADVVRVLEAIQESLKTNGTRVMVPSHDALNSHQIPLVDLKANYKRIKGEVTEAMLNVVDNTQFVLGPQVKKFEDNFAAWCGVKHCIGINSGTDALYLALKFLDIGPGDEVITQGNTFIASVLGISNVGATPVLVDHDEYFMMAVDKIEAAITPKTKAIMPVHLYGHCADMDKIMAIAKKHNLKVVEDTSQAHGALYKGKRVGSIGHVGCFSCYPGKNLGAYGDAGVLVTNDDELATRVQWWRSWGAKKKYHHELKGGNSRLDTIQAVVLDTKLPHMDKWNGERANMAAYYSEQLVGVGDIVTPKTPPDTKPVWHLYVCRTEQRDALLDFLNKKGVGAGIHYPIPIHELGAYKEEFKDAAGTLPETSKNASKLLSLPMFPELTKRQVDTVVALCKEFFSTK